MRCVRTFGSLGLLSRIWTVLGYFQPNDEMTSLRFNDKMTRKHVISSCPAPAGVISSCLLGSLAVHEQRRFVLLDRGLIDDNLVHVGGIRQFEHRIDQRLLQDGTQAAGPG